MTSGMVAGVGSPFKVRGSLDLLGYPPFAIQEQGQSFQGERGGCVTVLCSCQTTSRVLGSVLGITLEEGCGEAN